MTPISLQWSRYAQWCMTVRSEHMMESTPGEYFIQIDTCIAGNNPKRVMMHLSKCFQAIDRLLLDESGSVPKGTGVVSCVGIEECTWTSPLALAGKVEEYMNGIIDKMRGELKIVLLNSVKAYPAKPRTKWLFDWPSQVLSPTRTV
jgi:dynein heavy chain, axonemal